MPKLPKLTLSHDDKTNRWDLTNDHTDEVLKTFATKAQATAGGVLAKAVGNEGGSVKVQKVDGRFQEERTFPRSKDPKKSPG